MARSKPTYNDAFRATVVAALIADGYPEREGALTRVSRSFGLHPRTVSRWANGENNPPPDNVVKEKRSDLADLIETEIYEVLGLMPDKRERANYSQLTVALGVLIDKMRLLRNLPTEIVAIMPRFIEAAQKRNLDPQVVLSETINQMEVEFPVEERLN